MRTRIAFVLGGVVVASLALGSSAALADEARPSPTGCVAIATAKIKPGKIKPGEIKPGTVVVVAVPASGPGAPKEPGAPKDVKSIELRAVTGAVPPGAEEAVRAVEAVPVPGSDPICVTADATGE